MSLPRRWFIALASLGGLAVLFTLQAQETIQGPTLFTSEARPKDISLTRTGARKTMIVSAIDRVKGAVVNIHSERNATPSSGDLFPMHVAPNRVNGMGTGIIIDHRGYIVTNQHVIEDVSALRIRLADGSTENAIVVGRHPELDLAVIKIPASRALPVMPLGTASDLMIGETVIAIGNAYGYEHTASVGIISALKRDVSLNKDMSYKALIQTDASINPGNSGGPLVNVHGELVGVNVAIRAGAQGIGFAIPVDHMVKSVSDMLRARRRPANYEGFAYRDLLQQTSDGPVRRVIVDRIDSSSPAETAALKTSDVLTRIGDIKIASSIDVERALMDRKPGESIAITVQRSNQDKQLELALGAADRQVRPASVADVLWQKLGLQFTPVAGDVVTRVNNQLQGGLEVTNINANGIAAKSGIQKGDILVGLHNWETVHVDNVNYVLTHPDLATFHPIPFFIVRGGQLRRGQISMLP